MYLYVYVYTYKYRYEVFCTYALHNNGLHL